MPAQKTLPTPDALPTGDTLVEALQQWHDIDRVAAPEFLVPELRTIDAHRPAVERAKGALMLRYGMDAHHAFEVMVRWSRLSHTPVHILAETLVRGISAGPQTEFGRQPLARWLRDQLRHDDP
jgi:hypothetical protein